MTVWSAEIKELESLYLSSKGRFSFLYKGKEDTYRILLNLVNTGAGEVIRTEKVQGNLRTSGYLLMADSLCDEIRNWLEITALEENADYDLLET